MKLSKIRGLIALGIFVLVAVSLATHAATGTLSAFGVDSIAAICPLGALEVMFGFRGVLLHPLILLIVIVALTLVVGKAFCSWVCPTPWIRSLFRRPGKKRRDESTHGGSEGRAAKQEDGSAAIASRPQEPPLCPSACSACGGTRGNGRCALDSRGGKRDGFRLDTRFAVLVGALASTAVFGFPVFCLVCPIGLSFAVFIGVWHLFQFNEVTWGLVVFPAILAIEVVAMRKWCHAFCPVSALLSLVSTKNRFFRPRVDASKCLRSQGVDCRACVDACPELVDPHSASIPECSKCGICRDACPVHAISFPLLRDRVPKKVSDQK